MQLIKHTKRYVINQNRDGTLAFVIQLLCFTGIKTEYPPSIPCPKNFQYISFGSENLGLLRLERVSFREIVVDVEFAQAEPMPTNFSGSISLNQNYTTTRANLESEKPISYRIDFPNPSILPMLVSIKVNGETICSNTEAEHPSIVFNLQHIFDVELPTTTTSRISINRIIPEQSGNEACGREGITPFEVQGHDFPRGKFPWLAAIYHRDSADLKFICGGFLISTRTVISAAYCFLTWNFSPDIFSVYLGQHNLFVSEEGSQQRDVASLTIHPDYNISPLGDADIALLHLAIEVTFNQYIRPVCLWTHSSELMFIEEQIGFNAGWNCDNEGNIVTVAKMVKAKIVSESECLRSFDFFRILAPSRTFCARNHDRSGPCIRASGLMINVFGVWTLRGIVSDGRTIHYQGYLQETFEYCDVAKHMTWVRQNMN